jgi:hypothetical protein
MVNYLTLDDHRPISSLVIDSNQRVRDWNPVVGADGITKIDAYNEFSGADYVLWFAIYVGEEITWRVNGKYVVEVGYGK